MQNSIDTTTPAYFLFEPNMWKIVQVQPTQGDLMKIPVPIDPTTMISQLQERIEDHCIVELEVLALNYQEPQQQIELVQSNDVVFVQCKEQIEKLSETVKILFDFEPVLTKQLAEGKQFSREELQPYIEKASSVNFHLKKLFGNSQAI